MERRVLGLATDAQLGTAVPGWGASLAGLSVVLGLIAAFLAVGLGLPARLPLQAASWLTFLAVVIAPGYLLGDIVTWSLDLDLLERLALAMPLGVAVMAVPGLVAMLGHLTLEDLAVGWTLTVGCLIALWLIHRLVLRRGSQRSICPPWRWSDFAMLLLLVAAFVYVFPTLSLYKMDGDAYAVASFTADALTGRPLNATEPILGTGRSMGSIRMGMNQLLPVFHLWAYFSRADHIELLGTASRSMLALWAILAAYMLGKSAGHGSRRVGFLTASIQMLVYLAAPFVRADHVGIFFFERTNADKFTVTVTMLPVVAALAIRYVSTGRRDTLIARATWLAAALAGFAVSSIHALIAAMLALALGAFGGLHLLVNLRRREAWKRVGGLALLTVIVMIMPLIQLFEARSGEAMAPTYPSSFEGWSIEERLMPILPSALSPERLVTLLPSELSSLLPSTLPSYQMGGLDVYGPLPDLAYLDAEQVNTATNPFLIWRFALNMRRQRIIVFDLERYISNPTLILEPPYLLALLLLPFLLWRLRSNPGAQFCLGASLAVLFVLFNPILTPILGSLVMPWILWRFVWLLPYALIIALVLDRLLAALVWPLTHWPKLKPVRVALVAISSLGFVVLAALLLRQNVVTNVEEMHARGVAPMVYATPDKILARLRRETAWDGPVMVLADGNLSVTIPAFAGNADIVAHRIFSTAEMLPADQQDLALQRHIDQYEFLNTPLLTPVHIDILERYGIRYVVVPGGTSLEAQLRLSPQWFDWLVADDGYILYAVRQVPPITESILGNAAFLDRRWEAASTHYQAALDQDHSAGGTDAAGAGGPGMLALLGLADIYRVNGQFDQALLTLRQALAQAQTDSMADGRAAPVVHYRMGQVYADVGQVERSIEEFDLARRGDPSSFAYHMALGDACLGARQNDCAQEQFGAAVDTLGLAGEAQRLMMLGSIWMQRANDGMALSLYEQAAAASPGEETQLALADMYRNVEQFDQAEELLVALRQRYPLSVKPDAHLRILSALARLRAGEGKANEAVGLFQYIIWLQEQLAQDTRFTRLVLAQTLLDAGGEDRDSRAGRFDRARDEIGKVLSLQPHSAAAYVLLGNLYRAQHEPRLAMEAYRYALRVDPTEAAAYTSLSDQHRQQATPPSETLVLMQSAVEYNPEQVILAISLADQFRRMGDVEMAITTYQQALGWFDSGSAAVARGSFSGPQPTGRTRSLSYSRLAALYEDLGQIDTAMNYYQAAVTAAPDQPWTWVTLGDALRRRNRASEAEEAYRTAMQEDPVQVDAYLRLASLMSDRGDSSGSSELYQQALQITKDGTNLAQTSRAWLTLGSYYSQSPRAEVEFGSGEDLLVEDDSTNPVTERALIAYHQALEAEESAAGVQALARLYQDLGQPEEAIQLYKGRIQEGEQDKWVPSLLAQYYVGLGDAYLDGLLPEKALAAFAHAVDLDGWWSGARLALARGYSEQGNQRRALAELRRAVEIAPGAAEVQLSQAGALDEQGDNEQALAIYQATAQAHPGSAPANLALARAWQARYRWDMAEQSYRQAMAMVPGDIEAYLGLASLYVLRARTDEAEVLLNKALEIDRTHLETYLQLGAFLAHRARHAEALDVYRLAVQMSESWQGSAGAGQALTAAYTGLAGVQRALGEVEQVEDSLKRAVEVNEASTATGTAAAPLLQLAGLYREQNQPDKAELALLLALDMLLNDVTSDRSTSRAPGSAQVQLRIRLALAEFYQSMAQSDKALEVLRLAVEEDPESMAALTSYANQLRLMGRVEEADLVYLQAQDAAEPSRTGYQALAAALQAQGQETVAMALLNEATIHDPRDASAWIQKGRLQMQLDQQSGELEIGNPTSAWVEALERATEIEPAQGRTWNALGNTLLAAADDDGEVGSGDQKAAGWNTGTAALEQAITIDPMYLPAYGALLDAYREPAPASSGPSGSGQGEQAAAIVQMTKLAVPGSHLGHLYEARLQEDLHQWDRAREALDEAMIQAPGQPEAYVARGQLEQQQGNNEEAAIWYRWANDLRPGDQASYLNLVDLLLSQGDNLEALRTAQKAVGNRPGDSDLLLRLGRIQRILGRYADAEPMLLQAARLDPFSDSISAELAVIYEAQGKFEEAIAAYDQALSLNPEQGAYYLALSRLWSARGRPEHALSLLEGALSQASRPVPLYVAMSDLYLRRGEPRLALEILEEGLELFGEDVQLWQALGAYFQSQAEFDRAEEAYRHAAIQEPDENAADAGQGYLALGGFYLSRGRAEKALAEYEQAAASDAMDAAGEGARAHLALGNVYRVMGRTEQAIGAYSEAIKLAPRSEDAYIGLASVYRSQARWQDSRTALLDGLAVVPTSDRLLKDLSDLLLQRGDEEGALDLLDQAVQLSAGARTYVARAALYRVLGRPDEAMRDLEMARQIEPGSVEALAALGGLYRSLGDVTGAKEAYRLVLSLAPGSAASHMGLADLALDQGQLDEAWWQFEAAHKAEPASSGPVVGLAAARSRQNDWEEAEAAYRRAAELAPAATAPYIGLADLAHRNTGSVEDALAWLGQIDSPGLNRGVVHRTLAGICGNSPASAGCSPGLAAEALQQAVQLEPDRPEANLALAKLYLAEGRPHEAGPHVSLALEVAPRDPAVRIAQGDIHHVLGDAATAENSYREAIGLDATRLDGYEALAQFYVAEEQYAEAVAAYQEAIRVFPLDWPLWVSLGNVYLNMESYADALSAFEQAAEMNPSALAPWLGQGDAYMAKEKWEAAQKAYEQAQRLGSQQTEPSLRLANLSEEQEDMKKATQYARQAIEVDPTSAVGYVSLGRLLQEREQIGEAADAFLSAIKLDPRRHAAYNRWMWCYMDIKRVPYSVDRSRLKAELAKIAEGDQLETVWAQILLGLGYITLEEEIERAIEHLEKAAGMDPAYAELYQDLALAHEEGRDGPRALEWWQRYLYAVSRGSDTSEAQKQIDNLRLVQIEQPSAGDPVSGTVKIVGTAKGKLVLSYKLEVRAVGSEKWSTIGTGTERVTSGPLATWDTSELSPGEYQLRLDVVKSDGDFRPYDEITVVVQPSD